MVNEHQSQSTGRKGTPLNAPGGEVVQLSIKVNGKVIYMRNATLFEDGKYRLDDGSDIAHGRVQGPIELVKKILNRL